MQCRCTTLTELYGREAEQYVSDHLTRDETRPDDLEELYACPDTGRQWVLDWPERTERDLGQARLRSG